VIAIGVAKGVALHAESIRQLSDSTLHLLGLSHQTLASDVVIDKRFLGQDYAVPTQGAADAAHWAAHRGAWILDPVYTAKGFSGLLGIDTEGGFQGFRNVVFIHTGGLPSVFATHSQ
jgi:1-aminocyclopropane-1-carboxylate deaminase/D-cysteine desulfhydrase-like pyridoxal-dependent ACC family enzyme